MRTQVANRLLRHFSVPLNWQLSTEGVITSVTFLKLSSEGVITWPIISKRGTATMSVGADPRLQLASSTPQSILGFICSRTGK